MGNGIYGKTPQTRDTKRAHVLNHSCRKTFHKNSLVNNPKSKVYTMLFKKNFKTLVEILVCLFCGALK